MFSLVFQAVGTGLSARSSGDTQIGVSLALFGLAFQLFTIVMFCTLFTDYLIRYVRSGHSAKLGWRVKAFLSGLAFATLLIALRSAYRVYELRDGFRGTSLREEAPFIGIEGVLVYLP